MRRIFAAQRNDLWTLAGMHENYTGKKSAAPTRSRAERGELVQALRAADLHRRLAEARTFLEEHPNSGL